MPSIYEAFYLPLSVPEQVLVDRPVRENRSIGPSSWTTRNTKVPQALLQEDIEPYRSCHVPHPAGNPDMNSPMLPRIAHRLATEGDVALLTYENLIEPVNIALQCDMPEGTEIVFGAQHGVSNRSRPDYDWVIRPKEGSNCYFPPIPLYIFEIKNTGVLHREGFAPAMAENEEHYAEKNIYCGTTRPYNLSEKIMPFRFPSKSKNITKTVAAITSDASITQQ
ncbi:hypothetical protein TRVA0_020S01970 [Trichomonascus vanleenenianus]|uniref:uncharacterized protein n=1 Tax=Trichomonascus vanleenenianus TaxID=2268995 RepID=UPI003ECBAA3B